ncbi:MAG: ATP synthase F1 subunit epsilon [Chloroflexi bacterium]|nr:ATP synthase F1 subunit epsilon [Chloroflexota bacterium]|tara:strand:- start:8073 stop:8324 length:252 start_codon:yes stop_codon:yes gene_type:complete
MSKLFLELVTNEGIAFSGQVDKVTAKGGLGEFTILPSHADFMSTLLSGNLVVTAEGEPKKYSLTGGFVEVSDNKVTILADSIE